MASKRPLVLLPLSTQIRAPTCVQCQIRSLHKRSISPRVPKPTPFVPDHSAFLKLIGRGMSAHTAKIQSWEALFTMSSQQLKDSGIEPPRARRYLLWWRERFRNGLFGIGGDLEQVKDGIAELRIVEVPAAKTQNAPATLSRDSGMRKMVVNVPPTVAMPPDPANPEAESKMRSGGLVASLAPPPIMSPNQAKRVERVKIFHGNVIGGTGIEYIRGFQGVARLRVQDGLWEEKRGRKVDGGERRRVEVRAKRRAAERRDAR